MDEELVTKNKGEWSEFYVFLKILSERRLIPADSDLNPVLENALPVLKIYREETSGKISTYDISSQPSKILIYLSEKDEPGIIDSGLISSKLATIFSKINTGILVDPDRDELMKTLKCSVFRAMPGGSKEDIKMVIHDPVTAQSRDMSYSIKSQVGSPSTLLNASNATNFIYEVSYPDINLEELNLLKGAGKIVGTVNSKNGSLKFVGVNNDTFNQNMELIDYLFPEIMAYLLQIYYSSSRLSKISEIVESLDNQFVLPISGRTVKKSEIIFKLKTFLVAIALGMTPSKEWNGNLSANGGYLIVKTDGSVLCYHIFNLDSFKEYLFNTTKFEKGSETRHKYGKIYNINDRHFINLNLQIRFLK